MTILIPNWKTQSPLRYHQSAQCSLVRSFGLDAYKESIKCPPAKAVHAVRPVSEDRAGRGGGIGSEVPHRSNGNAERRSLPPE
jgi:hypothetical protein